MVLVEKVACEIAILLWMLYHSVVHDMPDQLNRKKKVRCLNFICSSDFTFVLYSSCHHVGILISRLHIYSFTQVFTFIANLVLTWLPTNSLFRD